MSSKTPREENIIPSRVASSRRKINSPLSVMPTLFLSPDASDTVFLQQFANNKESSHTGKYAKVKNRHF